MWIFTEHGFLSVVRNRREDEPSTLMVRARRADALASISRISQQPILQTPVNDYPYRVIVDEEVFGAYLASIAETIDYTNFKGRVSKLDRNYEHALHEVWATMRMQEDENARRFT